MEKERISLYDNYRAALIWLVVVGHGAEFLTLESGLCRSIYVFVYAFHMPAFLFLAGMFFREQDAVVKARGYIFVGFAMKILFSLASTIGGGDTSFALLSDPGLPWFMFVLAIYSLFACLTEGMNKCALLVFSVALGCFVGYDETVGDQLYLSRTIVFYPFFVLGQLCGRKELAALSRRPALRWAGGVVLLLWGALCLFAGERVYLLRPLFTGRNPFSCDPLFQQGGFLWRLLCYGISLSTGFALLCVVPAKPLPAVTTCGKRTLQIYFWHVPILKIMIRCGLLSLLCVSGWGRLLWLLMAHIPLLLTSSRIFSFPTKQILEYARPTKEKQNADQ